MRLATTPTLAVGLAAVLVATMASPVVGHNGIWQTRGAYWLMDPAGDGPTDLALRLETVEPLVIEDPVSSEEIKVGPLVADHGSISFSPPDGVRAGELVGLSFDMYLEAGACGGGAPRMTLRIDGDGDDVFDPAGDPDDFYVGALPQDVLSGMCPTGSWVTYDLTDDASARWFPGGEPSAAAAALTTSYPDHEVHRVDLQFDNTVTPQFGPAIVWFDNIVVHDHTLVEPIGELTCPATVEPGYGPCPSTV